MALTRTAYNFIHSHGALANVAYKGWRGLYEAKEVLRPLAPVQQPDATTGLYEMHQINIAITAVCNAKCVFCVHHLLGEPSDMMSMGHFEDVIRQWKAFVGTPKNHINLTPSAPPGEPLANPNFLKKIQLLTDSGFKAFFVTNGILLHRVTDELLKFEGTRFGISFPSFNTDVYKEVYGVDRGAQVTNNLFALLEKNARAGEPLDIRVCFRNKETPAQIMAHPNFQRLKEYFSDKVTCMFTTWWDTWNGGVEPKDMERGEIKVRKPLNLKRVCEGALSFSIRPTDRLIRLCGCRYVVGLTGKDDLVVGDLDEGFHAAQRRAAEIQDDFKRGVRQKTCQSCGAYKQAT
jgi:organic radical activating enzyme